MGINRSDFFNPTKIGLKSKPFFNKKKKLMTLEKY